MNRRLPIWDHPVLNKEFRQRMRIARTPWIIFLYLGIAGTLIFAYMFLIAHPAGPVVPELHRGVPRKNRHRCPVAKRDRDSRTARKSGRTEGDRYL